MNLKNKLPYLALFVAGGASMLAFAPFNRGIFIILSLLALFWFSTQCLNERKSTRLILGSYIYAAGYFLAQLYWIFYSLDKIIQTGLIVAILAQLAFSGVMAIFTMLSLWMFKRLATKSLEFNYLILLPSCWVLGEWLRGWIFTGFPWCDVGYTQVSNPLLNGFYPLIGNYGVSWILVSIVGFLLVVIYNRQHLMGSNPQLRRPLRYAVIYLALLAISGYYLHDKQYTQAYGKPTKVALVQGNVSQVEKWDNASFISNLGMYAELISNAKADIVILPETSIAAFMNDLPPHYVEDITRFAKLNNAELVIGIPRQINPAGDYVNSATVFTESGLPYYAKSHLVPFGEYIPFKHLIGKFYELVKLPMVGFSAGNLQQKPLVLASQKVAFNICYENGFASELLPMAKEATIMANISDMVWYGNSIAKDEHLQISQARALENQRYFIQDTNTGATAIINPQGQIQSQLPAFTRDVLTDYVQGRIGVTPYQQYGNYPLILLCLIILLLALGLRKFNNLVRD